MTMIDTLRNAQREARFRARRDSELADALDAELAALKPPSSRAEHAVASVEDRQVDITVDGRRIFTFTVHPAEGAGDMAEARAFARYVAERINR